MSFYVIDNEELEEKGNPPALIKADSLADAYLDMDPSDSGDEYLGTFDREADAARFIDALGAGKDVEPSEFNGVYDEEDEIEEEQVDDAREECEACGGLGKVSGVLCEECEGVGMVDAEDDEAEPEEDDIFAQDHKGPFYYHHKEVAADRAALRAWMKAQGYFPNVWLIEERGGYAAITDLDDETED